MTQLQLAIKKLTYLPIGHEIRITEENGKECKVVLRGGRRIDTRQLTDLQSVRFADKDGYHALVTEL